MKKNIASMMLLSLFVISTASAGPINKPLKKDPPTHGRSGPGMLAGLDFGYNHNAYHYTSSGKTHDQGPSSTLSFTPTFQMPIAGNWAGSVGFNLNSYDSRDNYGNNYAYHSTVKESYSGPSISLYRYCDDPCDDDDWYPYIGVNYTYLSGMRTYKNWDDNDPMHIINTENGKLSSSSVGLFGGAYYALAGSVGLFGRVNLLNYTTWKTYDDKSNTNTYRSSDIFDFFSGGSLGIYVDLDGKNKK